MKKTGMPEKSEIGNRRPAGEVAAAVTFRLLGVVLLLWGPSLLSLINRKEVRFNHPSNVRVQSISNVDWVPLRNLVTFLAPRRTVQVIEGARCVWQHEEDDFPVPADSVIRLDGRRVVFIPPVGLETLRFAVDLDSGEVVR